MSEIPKWQSHKTVTADKVTGVTERFDHADPAGPQHIIIWHLACGLNIVATKPLRDRVTNDSPIGGYCVLYSDGYESWSPAAAFEAGYTRV